LASPKFDAEVASSIAIPDGTVIAAVPEGFAVAYGSGAVSVETSNVATLHSDDLAPLAIIGADGTMAAPSRSMFQQSHIGLKVRAAATWLVHPGAAATMSGCEW
jgi:hypothetical protein